MSFTRLQSAPERHGDVDVSLAAWAGSSDPTVRGVYRGTRRRTITLTVTSATGTVGTNALIMSWADLHSSSDGASGKIVVNAVGTPAHLIDGVSLQFAAGTFNNGNGSVLQLYPANRLPPEAILIEGDTDPAMAYFRDASFVDEDFRWDAADRQVLRIARAQKRRAVVRVDYGSWNEASRRIRSQAARNLWTVGEGYSPTTICHFRGGHWTPQIGRCFDWGSSGVRTTLGYAPDPATGLLRPVAANRLRTAPGYETLGVAPTTLHERNKVPLAADHVTRSAAVSQAVTNLLPHWRPLSRYGGTTSTHWSVVGTATMSVKEYARGVLDPEADWEPKWLGHTPEVYCAAADDGIESGNGTVSSGQNLTGQAWVRGTGRVKLQARTGAGSPSAVLHETGYVQLDPKVWQKLIAFSQVDTVPGTHTVGTVRILGENAGVRFECDCAQLEIGNQPGDLVPTDGASATMGADPVTMRDGIPLQGSIFLAFLWPGDAGGGTYDLLSSVLSTFRLYRDATAGAELWRFYTDTADFLEVTNNPTNLAAQTWNTVGMTWAFEGTGGSTVLRRRLYYNGSQIGTDTGGLPSSTTDLKNGLVLCPTGMKGYRIAEFLCDASVFSATRMQELHDRHANPSAYQESIELYGQYLGLVGERSVRRTPNHPHQALIDLSFSTEQWDEGSLSMVHP